MTLSFSKNELSRFGDVDLKVAEPLKKIAGELPSLEFKNVRVKVLREDKLKVVFITPKPWSGRGLLGCHLTPL